MHTLLIYIIKMMICSGLLFIYYWHFLRNKRFHQYNRFYLLSSVVFSIAVPFLHLSWFTVQNERITHSSIVKILYTGELSAVRISDASVSWTQSVVWLIWAISIVMLLTVGIRVWQVIRLSKRYNAVHQEHISFFLTEIEDAPFSFFHYLFWKKSIDVKTTTGRQILDHELAHIAQGHSWDKMFLQITTAIFWFNPFYWLMQRELLMIHEFLADENAIKDKDAKAFAEMLIASRFQKYALTPVHPFAFRPIKRRLQMLTSSARPSYSYLRRLMFLPLLFVATGLLAITIKEKEWGSPKAMLTDWAKAVGINLSSYETLQSASRKNNLPDTVVIIHDNNKRDTLPNISPEKLTDLAVKIPQQDTIKMSFIPDTAHVIVRGTQSNKAHNWLSGGKPLIILDGTPTENMDAISPNDIESISILKGKSAEALYGAKAINGVVMITSKKGIHGNPKKENNEMEHVTVLGYGKPHKEMTNAEVDKQPSFVGGPEAWRNFLMRNLHADVPAQKGAPTGRNYTVIVAFTVGKDGALSDFYIANDPGYGTAQEVLRLMKTSPAWNPATKDGKSVIYRIRQQVTFSVEKQ